MMIPPASASPYAAAAALDRQFRSDDAPSADDTASTTLDAGPDVVVTLSQGASAPSTYDASGRMAGATAPDSGSDSAGDDASASADSDAAVPA